jgi:hypothetical protein
VNTAGRAFWVIWCCAWAGFWLTLAVLRDSTSPADAAILAVFAIASGLAIALPVGKTRMYLPPPDHPVWRNPQAPPRPGDHEQLP